MAREQARILLVDDEQAVQTLLTYPLRKEGYEVVGAMDGQEALDFYYASGAETLPGVYAPPEGRMFLATHSAKAAGCGAFHRMTQEACEMKRMYVRPEFRRMQIGRQLTQSLIAAAREAGYAVMRLETVTFMDKAIAMYSSFGFKTCLPYYAIPEAFRPITIFMQLDLASK